MPIKPQHFCNYSGCRELTRDSYCPKHTEIKAKERREYDKTRPYKHLYNSARWQYLRKKILFVNPLCVECEKQGIATPATIADHIRPHKGNINLFFDPLNLQGLCKRCHDTKTSREESWNSN
jgi:5-methylcytosine-specific restriction protein A